MGIKTRAAMAAAAGALAACSRGAGFTAPELSDAPVLAAAQAKDLPVYVPGYGIAVPGGNPVQFEVNIEADDGPLVDVGQSATAYILPERRPIACRVSRILRRVSEETGQSIAWLEPSERAPVPVNEFVYVNILVRTRRRVLTAPKPAVLSRDGRLYVVRASTGAPGRQFSAVEVSTGVASGEDVEIVSGLSAGDSVVVQGGVGFLYPDFKSEAGD